LLKVDEAFRHMSVWGYFTNSNFVAFGGDVHSPHELRDYLPTTYVTSLDGTGETGWSWHIPLRQSTSVGLVLPRKFMKTVRDEGESWEAYFLRTCRSTPVLERLLENATFVEGSLRIIRDYSYVTSEVAGPGFFLVGDAAGFHDPIFSVGIVLGMYAAYGAAWAIDRCLKNPEGEQANQAMFAQMLRGRIEMARSLALPTYRTAGNVSEMAKKAVDMESTEVQNLMYAVSKLTTRSDNYRDMTGTDTVPDVGEERLLTIETVNFLQA
jgi:flavin-dependent dehydrogenase